MTAEELEAESQRLYDVALGKTSASQWICELRTTNLEAIAAVMSRLASTGATGAQLEGMRESARAVLEARLAENLLLTTERLERSAARLSVVAIIATVVIGLAGIVIPVLWAR